MGDLRGAFVAGALLIAAALPAVGQTDGPAHLVKNINRGIDSRGSSYPRAQTVLGGFTYFIAESGHFVDAGSYSDNWELWRTDGTPVGTVALRTLGVDLPHPSAIVAFGGDLVIAADGLWRTDGTPLRTRLLEPDPAEVPTVAGNTLYFVREQSLWATDGSPGGAHLVAQFGEDIWSLDELVAVDGALFFTACDAPHGCELWHSDGTGQGTSLLADLAPGPDSGKFRADTEPEHAVLSGILYFLAQTADAGIELWRSDGTTAGTRMVKDIWPGPENGFARAEDQVSSYRAKLTALGELLYFIASDGVHGFELWRSDGSEAGTWMVADSLPGSVGLFDNIALDDGCDTHSTPMTTVGGMLFFTSCISDEGRQLWQSDGTAAGTKRIEAPVSDSGFAASSLAGFEGNLYFLRRTESGGTELRRRAVNASDSSLVAEVPGTFSNLAPAANGLFMSVCIDATGCEPWWSDGSAAGTYLLRDIRGDDASSTPQELIAFGDGVLLSADDGAHGRELWRSDATEAGTQLVADIAAGAASSNPTGPVRLGDAVLFVADDGVHGAELWRSDGTTAGTQLVADIRPGPGGSSLSRLIPVGERMLFYADDGAHGAEPWRSDGTPEGTALVRDINPGAARSRPVDRLDSDYLDAAVFDGALYFSADDGVHGAELWRSDGSAAGTSMVLDILPGGEESDPGSFVAAPGYVLFYPRGPSGQWQTDGTAAGTHPSDMAVWLNYGSIVASGDGAYALGFDERTDTSGVWRVEAGDAPVLVAARTDLSQLFDVGGALFGLGYSGALWRLDASLTDETGWWYAEADQFAISGRRLLLYDDYYRMLWTTDGTVEGEIRLQYLPPPDYRYWGEDSDPSDFTAAGAHIFFAAASSDVGKELWALPVDALPEVCVDDCPWNPTPTATETPEPPTSTATAVPPTRTPTSDCGDACTRVTLEAGSGEAGATVTLTARLTARREPIAGLQLDLGMSDALSIAAVAHGRPDCRVDAALDKAASPFGFLPPGCQADATCTQVRVVIVSLDNVDPIADGAALFTCRISIAPRTRPGSYEVGLTSLAASDPNGAPVPLAGSAGIVTVVGQGTRDLAVSHSDGCQTASGATAGRAWALLAGSALLGLFRRWDRGRPIR